MSKTLIISGHPDLNLSNANKAVLARVEGLPGVTVRRLDALYPDFGIDVPAEQAALLEADTVVLQFPFHWYSVPALLKLWMDQVLAYGFAYGSTGDKLRGKTLIVSTTIGGPAASYQRGGYNHFSITDLLKPLEQTANLTGMTWHPPVVSHGMIFIPGVYNTLEAVLERAEDHASRLGEAIRAL